MRGLRGEAAIAGAAEFSPIRKPTRTWMGLEAYAELARLALEDAGLSHGDVDALITGNVAEAGAMFGPGHLAEYLGIQSHLSEVVDLGGATGAGAVLRAAMAIEAGLCETALCIVHSMPRPRDPSAPAIPPRRGNWGSPMTEFDYPFGAVGQNYAYAIIANRYAHEFTVTDEQRAKVAVDQRFNACAHPQAVFRSPISVDDVLNSPMIADPLHMLEIVMPCAGGAAVVVTSRERARSTSHRPVFITGGGENTTRLTVASEMDIVNTPIRAAADRAFDMAGLKREDIHLASLYDCYTITVLLTLEDAGFCAKGEAGRFVEAHDMTYLGDFPMNTHGGQLSFGQAGLAGGMSHVTEAYLQVAGRAGERQLKRCDNAFVNGNGGLMSEQVSLVLQGA